jgi:CHASE2 domain-containing sensor protein
LNRTPIAGGLATLGVFLGTTGAYLAAQAQGLPLIATMAGWLTSGRGIVEFARQPME